MRLDEGTFAAVVERVMCDEGWVCNPADHEDIPQPGECIDCDGERHRLGYRLYAALAPPARPDAAVVAGGGECACPPGECHAAGAPGCYFGAAPAEPVTEAQGGAE
jgi:hypothetical protein